MPSIETFLGKCLEESKKLRIFAPEKWGKKHIDNIRPP